MAALVCVGAHAGSTTLGVSQFWHFSYCLENSLMLSKNTLLVSLSLTLTHTPRSGHLNEDNFYVSILTLNLC